MIINITHGLEYINVYLSIKKKCSGVINISGRFFYGLIAMMIFAHFLYSWIHLDNIYHELIG